MTACFGRAPSSSTSTTSRTMTAGRPTSLAWESSSHQRRRVAPFPSALRVPRVVPAKYVFGTSRLNFRRRGFGKPVLRPSGYLSVFAAIHQGKGVPHARTQKQSSGRCTPASKQMASPLKSRSRCAAGGGGAGRGRAVGPPAAAGPRGDVEQHAARRLRRPAGLAPSRAHPARSAGAISESCPGPSEGRAGPATA